MRLFRPQSIRTRLLSLLAVAIVPFIIAAVLLGGSYTNAELRVLQTKRFDQVNNLSRLLDGEIRAADAIVATLAPSASLKTGDFAAFRLQATGALGDRIALLAVLEANGQQVFSTAIPEGESLPKSVNIGAFLAAFRGERIVSDVLRGTVAGRPVVTVAAPVFVAGQVKYVLSAVIYPEKLIGLFAEAGINPEWAAAVVDRQGKFVIRNLSPEKYIGEQARPELVQAARGADDTGVFSNRTVEGVDTENSFRRSTFTGWTSVVSVPSTVILAPFINTWVWVSGVVLAFTLASGAFAMFLADRISQNIRGVGQAANALIEGKPFIQSDPYIAELNEVYEVYEIAQTALDARRENQKHIEFLVAELSHRSKNLLAIIISIASQTSRSAKSTSEFLADFHKRLQALAASHDFLFDTRRQGALLQKLVEDHLAPFVSEGSKVSIVCGNVVLRPEAVQPLGMAMHELATNASKYGAWSIEGGKVTVVGELSGDEPDRRLSITWVESGGPPVSPPTRTGFGSLVVDRMLSGAIDATIVIDFRPTGLFWKVTMPEQFVALPDAPPHS